jgi:hypothetical protein
LEKRKFFDDSAANKREGKSLQRLGLTVVLALSAFLNLSWLRREAYANVYYAATVKNMLASWHNFFLASFDAGFVSVDKPLWGFGSRRPAPTCSASTGGAYCFPRRSRGSSVWPCSTIWWAGALGQ